MRLLSEQAIDDLKSTITICNNLHEKIVYRSRKRYDPQKKWKGNPSPPKDNDSADFTEKSHQEYLKKNQKITVKLIENIKKEISLAFKAVSRFFGKKN